MAFPLVRRTLLSRAFPWLSLCFFPAVQKGWDLRFHFRGYFLRLGLFCFSSMIVAVARRRRGQQQDKFSDGRRGSVPCRRGIVVRPKEGTIRGVLSLKSHGKLQGDAAVSFVKGRTRSARVCDDGLYWKYEKYERVISYCFMLLCCCVQNTSRQSMSIVPYQLLYCQR